MDVPTATTAARRSYRFRGRRLGSRQLLWIQGVIDEHPDDARAQIARRLCVHFGWYRLNGEPAVGACCALLRRLAAAGLVRLQTSRSGNSRGHRRHEEPRHSPAPPPEPAIDPASPLEVRPLRADEREGFREHLQRYHYLGYRQPVGESVPYAAFLGETLVAFLAWGAAVLHNGPRDRWIGWDSSTKARRVGFVVNNTRFLVLVRRPHLASRILGANLRRLSRDWKAAYGHPVVLAETFVDSALFRGTCYRASNWLYVGETRGFSRSGTHFEKHGRRKSVFVYPLHRKATRWLREAQSPLEPRMPKEDPMVCSLDSVAVEGRGGLLDVFRGMTDPRVRKGRRYPLHSILAITTCAVLAGARSVRAIADWAQDLTKPMLRRFGITRLTAPSESAMRRTLRGTDAEELDRRLGAWLALQSPEAAASLDGKTVRGSGTEGSCPVQLVSLVLHREGLTLAQKKVADGGNEITAAKDLLGDPAVDLKGKVVTGDAIFTQQELAKTIVEKKGDYVLAIKQNQPSLLSSVERLQLEAFPPGSHDD